MKQIFYALLGIVFLLSTLNSCNAQPSAPDGHAYAVEQQVSSTDEAEEQTEENLYHFIHKDVIPHKDTKEQEGVYYYAEFPTANNAYNAMLNLITHNSGKEELNKNQKYDTPLVTLEWKENGEGKPAVKGGFAQIDVTFKTKGEKCTVVFCRK